MKKKIVFFDIDGTLIDEKTGNVPKSAIDAIHKAQQNGHLLFVNTGRPSVGVDQKILDIGFDGLICGCGTYIEYQGKTIFHTTLDEEVRQEVIRQIYRCNTQSIIEGTKGVFFTERATHPHCVEFFGNYRKNHTPIGVFHEDDLFEFDKFVILYDATSDIQSMRQFLEQYFDIIERGEDFWECVPLGYSKATGIQYLLDYLGMDLEQSISIGDSTNDLSMLEYTGRSVAMGNSNPILFDKVTYITADVDKDGVAQALHHYELI